MFAIRQHQFGEPEMLLYEQVDDPVPGDGQVRIVMGRRGAPARHVHPQGGDGGTFQLPDLPMTPGREMAGTVDTVGAGADTSWTGQRVVAHLGMASGGYAEMAVADATRCIGSPTPSTSPTRGHGGCPGTISYALAEAGR